MVLEDFIDFYDGWWQSRSKLDLKSHFPGDLTDYLPQSIQGLSFLIAITFHLL